MLLCAVHLLLFDMISQAMYVTYQGEAMLHLDSKNCQFILLNTSSAFIGMNRLTIVATSFIGENTFLASSCLPECVIN